MICTRRKRWTPLVLHWRRARNVRPIRKTVRMKSTVSLSFFPQVHLHFTTVVSNQNQQRTVRNSFLSATTVNRERVLGERVFGPRIKTDSVLRLLKKNYYINSQTFSKYVRLYASSPQRTPIPNQIQQPRASATFTSVFKTRQSTTRAELTKVFQTHSHIRDHHSQTLSFRSERETLLKSTQIYFERAEELCWRRTTQRTTVTEHVANANSPVSTYQQPQAGHAGVVETHEQSAPPATRQTTPPQVTNFDPRLVDRLTEDVIRRVEKRALIERQRRGL